MPTLKGCTPSRTGPSPTWHRYTGNTSGYTQFITSSADGRHAVTVSVNGQITLGSDSKALFPALRHIYELAVCAAR